MTDKQVNCRTAAGADQVHVLALEIRLRQGQACMVSHQLNGSCTVTLRAMPFPPVHPRPAEISPGRDCESNSAVQKPVPAAASC